MRPIGPVAGKILREMRRLARSDQIDLAAFRRTREPLRVPAVDDIDDDDDIDAGLDKELEDGPLGWVFWMRVVTDLAALVWPLLGLRHLRRLHERLSEVERVYVPEGPPKSPLLGSFHTSWCLADATVGSKRETLTTIAADLCRAYGASADLLAAWGAIAASYPGLYRIVSRAGMVVSVQELVTGERFAIEIVEDAPGDAGAVWWMRLLPPMPPLPAAYEMWTTITTPYVFLEPGAADAWSAYLDRQLADAADDKRAAAYRRLMKRGPNAGGWFAFIEEAYVDVAETAVELAGVPDRPGPADDHDADDHDAGDGDTPRDRVYRRLFQIARERGLYVTAIEEYRATRKTLAELPDEPLRQWYENEQMLVGSHAVYGVRDADGLTAIERLARESDTLRDDEHEVVRALAKGWFSVFEVLGVEIDEAIEVRDIFRRRRLRVRERLATRQLERGDLLVTWVSQWPEHAEFEGALVRFPRADAPRAQAFLNTVMDTLRKRRGLTWRQRHEELAPLAIAAIAKLNSELPQIKLTNFDGDALILSEAEYRVREPQVARALARAEELEDAGDGAFLWRDAEQNVIRARIEIEGDTLRAATNSRQRLEQTRRLLEDTLGDRIEHRADTFTEPNPILRADGMQPAPKLDGKPLPPEVCAALAEVLRERLTRWLDEPIPALGDKTPRQAVRSQRGRQDVATLLLKQEQIFARGSGPELTEALDFPALWAALGLDYPPPVAD